MIDWLLNKLSQEVPEALSVCEFDCPYNHCTVNDWVVCELREQALLQGNGISRITPLVRMETPVFSPSGLVRQVN